MRNAVLTILLAAAVPVMSVPAETAQSQIKRKPDLADIVAGTYEGSVVADVRGSSQSS